MTSSTQKRAEFARKISCLVISASIRGINLLPFSCFRTPEEQNKLFKQGKSNCDGYQKISKHQKWLAVDFVIIGKDGQLVWERTPEYETLGDIWLALGGIWGGNWRGFDDIYHFEYPE